MKPLLFFVLLLCCVFLQAAEDVKIKSHYSIRRIFRALEEEDLVKQLREFVKASRPNRVVGNPGHKKAREYIIRELKKIKSKKDNKNLSIQEFSPEVDAAIKMYQDDFANKIQGQLKPDNPEYQKWKKFTETMVAWLQSIKSLKGSNIIWEKKGSVNPEEVLIVSANYDGFGFDVKNQLLKIDPKENLPGSDDNGTGVAILLELAKHLSKLDIPRTIRLVFFDWQETGFLGSKFYVDELQKEIASEKIKFAGHVNLLMLGHDTKSFDKEKKTGNMHLYIPPSKNEASEKSNKLASYLEKAGDRINRIVNFEIIKKDFDYGDALSFQSANLPTVTFTQNWDNDFNSKANHTANDFVESINFKTFYNSFLYIGGSVIAWSYGLEK
ncbi:MAG: M28 family peptidase [Bacteriovoracia bacterium]